MEHSLAISTYFLARDSRFDYEKPYSMRYPPETDIPQSNFIQDKQQVRLRDMRQYKDKLIFDDCGFRIMDLQSSMSYQDFEDENKLKMVYREEIAANLKSLLGATHVLVLDHVIRRRHNDFPISTGEDWEHEQPTNLIHIDFSRNEAEKMIEICYGPVEAARIMQSPWQVINTWRPLHGPLVDWPLALCDASSVDFEADTMSADIVYPNWVTENVQVHYNDDQEWYYLSNHVPSEVLVFTSAQSNREKPDGCPHAGFANPFASPHTRPRESIESRVLVFYTTLKPFPPKIGNPLQNGA